MRIGSLFSGIGGLELGLEWSGLGHTVWQVEKDPFCRRVLAKHWPEVKRYEDIKEVGAAELEPVDIICGGFPCQPFSTASRGRRVAVDLWPDMLHVVCGLRPRLVVAENVAWEPIYRACLDLQAEGYKARPIEVPSSLVGTPHERVRWFMVADSDRNGESCGTIDAEVASLQGVAGVKAWQAGPPRLGMDDGVPHRMDRLRALGNAVVPQCSEVIGHIIQELM